MTYIDVSQAVMFDSPASPRPASPVETVRAERAGKLDRLRASWPELSGLLTVDLAAAFGLFHWHHTCWVGVAIILR